MPKYASNTTVSVERSVEQIKQTLKRYGYHAAGWLRSEDEDTCTEVLMFKVEGRMICYRFPMLQSDGFLKTPKGRSRTRAQADKACEQTRKQRWRVILLDLIACDCKYSQPEFLRLVEPLACGKVIRLAKHRVLYGRPEPKPAGMRGRKHGARFAFKKPETWGQPLEEESVDHPKWGQVKLRRWSQLHARSAADVEFEVVQAQVHLERERPPSPLWLLWLPPETIPPTVILNLETIWGAYDYRWPIEPGNRFRKQTLNWTRPHFQSLAAADRWTTIVTLAFWQLYLARPLVADCPLPWQPKQTQLTPARVQQGGSIFFYSLANRPDFHKRAEKLSVGLKASSVSTNFATLTHFWCKP